MCIRDRLGAVIQDLSLTEPRQGPIVRLLQVPVSLDALLFVLRDDRGVIRLSIDAEVPPDGALETGEIMGAVAEALGEQSLRALRSAERVGVRAASTQAAWCLRQHNVRGPDGLCQQRDDVQQPNQSNGARNGSTQRSTQRRLDSTVLRRDQPWGGASCDS